MGVEHAASVAVLALVQVSVLDPTLDLTTAPVVGLVPVVARGLYPVLPQ